MSFFEEPKCGPTAGFVPCAYIFPTVINIYNYSNYRFFLRDWLAEKKATGNPMTYEALGEVAGFTSKGFLTQILQGKTNLPKKMVEKLITALSFGKKECKYFTLLFQFNQAKKASLRSEMHHQIRDEFRAEAKSLAMDQFEYYQKWYYYRMAKQFLIRAQVMWEYGI